MSVRTSSRPSSSAKNGIARRRLLHAGELGPRQVEAESLLKQTMQRGQAERADRDPLEPSVRERALELERLRELRGLSQGREETDRLVVSGVEARSGSRPPTQGRATGRRRGRQGPAPARTRHVGRPAPQVRLHADRAASRRAPRAAAPPPAPAAAAARARARPRRDTAPSSSESPANESERLGLYAPADQHPVETLTGILDTLLPQHRLPDARLTGEDKRARAVRHPPKEHWIAPSSSSRPITAASPTA